MNIHHKNSAAKETILILHGWGSSIKSWEKVAEKLSQKYRVIVPDLPGFGNNPPPPRAWRGSDYQNWVLEFIKSNNLKIPLILVGHSFGGGLAMKLAIDHPELVKQLVLVAAARLYVRKSILKKIIGKAVKIGKRLDFLPFYDLVRRIIYRFVVRETDYTRVSGVMRETFVNVIKEDLTPRIGSIKAPTLIVWGDQDKATPVEHAYLLGDKIANSRVEIMKGRGHALNLECPDELAATIGRFAQSGVK